MDYETANAFKTCLEMIQQRGYTVLDKDDDRILANKQGKYKYKYI